MATVRNIAVVGLGYVGLPVAVAFGKAQPVIGFDISSKRIQMLKKGIDHTNELSTSELVVSKIKYTDQSDDLKSADFYIVAVPTPVDKANNPDLENLKQATILVAQNLKQNDIVVYESTVYPGATEEVCVPLLEQISGLTFGKDFSVGYSPERINPGDKNRTFEKIVKVVSANSESALNIVAELYGKVVTAGVHRASSIKVAEAAKIIENTQRDLNVALMNELSLIFSKMGIDTHEVLEAAKTKWNFQPFTPGLVGGHCIGVDPYYLTYKAKMLGHRPEVILAGRRINDGMGKYIAEQVIKTMLHQKVNLSQANIALLGMTFKEDCPDIRNSKVNDIITELKTYAVHLQMHDPLASPEETQKEYQVALTPWEKIQKAEVLIVAVAHRFYREMTEQDFMNKLKPGGIIFDIKSILNPKYFREKGFTVWRL